MMRLLLLLVESDRRRLLVLSMLVMTVVALLGVAITAHDLSESLPPSPYGWPDDQRLTPSAGLAIGIAAAKALVIVVAGGTLLVRICNPFLRRLEESEARLQAVFGGAGDGIITVSPNGTIESFNRAAEQIFDLPAHLALGRGIEQWIDFAPQDEQAIVGAAGADIVRAMLGGRDMVGRRDTKTFPIEFSVREIRWEQRVAFAVIVRDVTERRAAEEQIRLQMVLLEEAKTRLELQAAELSKSNRELDDFTYIASHDLKEPLRGISSYCQILLEDYGVKIDAEGQWRLASLVDLCRRLTRLIDDLLTYSQLGRTQPANHPVDLDGLVSDVLETLGPPLAQRRGRVMIEGHLPVVAADPTMVGQVLRNLIVNGLKFNESEQPEVRIGCLETDPATLYVSDNGIGIPPEQHGAIFAMFRRLHGRGQYEGTGAGLTFVRKIVEAHGGRVWVASEEGRGSTFYFTLAPGEPRECQELAACAAG